MVVDLAGWIHFFIGAAIGPVGQPYFLNALEGPAIGRAVLTEREITLGFSGLFLWEVVTSL